MWERFRQDFSEIYKISILSSHLIVEWSSFNFISYVVSSEDSSIFNQTFTHSNINSFEVERGRIVLNSLCFNELSLRELPAHIILGDDLELHASLSFFKLQLIHLIFNLTSTLTLFKIVRLLLLLSSFLGYKLSKCLSSRSRCSLFLIKIL